MEYVSVGTQSKKLHLMRASNEPATLCGIERTDAFRVETQVTNPEPSEVCAKCRKAE